MCSRAPGTPIGRDISHPPYTANPRTRDRQRSGPCDVTSLTGGTLTHGPQGRGRSRDASPPRSCPVTAATHPLRTPPGPAARYAMPTAIRPPAAGPDRVRPPRGPVALDQGRPRDRAGFIGTAPLPASPKTRQRDYSAHADSARAHLLSHPTRYPESRPARPVSTISHAVIA